jgi:hypothetical protein
MCFTSSLPTVSFFINNPTVLKNFIGTESRIVLKQLSQLKKLVTNLTPDLNFRYQVLKKIQTSFSSKKTQLNFIPIYKTTVIRFIEYISGNKTLIQFYPFINQNIQTS